MPRRLRRLAPGDSSQREWWEAQPFHDFKAHWLSHQGKSSAKVILTNSSCNSNIQFSSLSDPEDSRNILFTHFLPNINDNLNSFARPFIAENVLIPRPSAPLCAISHWCRSQKGMTVNSCIIFSTNCIYFKTIFSMKKEKGQLIFMS